MNRWQKVLVSRLMIYSALFIYMAIAWGLVFMNGMAANSGNTSGQVSVEASWFPLVMMGMTILVFALSFSSAIRCYLWVVTAPIVVMLVGIVLFMLIGPLVRGMPSYYFQGEALKFYQACSRDDQSQLKSYGSQAEVLANSQGRNAMPLLGFAVLNADESAIKNLIRLHADPLKEVLRFDRILVMAMTGRPEGDIRSIQYLHEAGISFVAFYQERNPWLSDMFEWRHWNGARYAISKTTEAEIQEQVLKDNNPLVYVDKSLVFLYQNELEGLSLDEKRDELKKGMAVRALLLAKLPEKDQKTEYTEELLQIMSMSP